MYRMRLSHTHTHTNFQPLRWPATLLPPSLLNAAAIGPQNNDAWEIKAAPLMLSGSTFSSVVYIYYMSAYTRIIIDRTVAGWLPDRAAEKPLSFTCLFFWPYSSLVDYVLYMCVICDVSLIAPMSLVDASCAALLLLGTCEGRAPMIINIFHSFL